MNSTFDVEEMYANFSENPVALISTAFKSNWSLEMFFDNAGNLISQCLFIGSLKP